MSERPAEDDVLVRINEGLTEVVRREQQLLDPALRASPEQLQEFLHPDYVEFGASGRVWHRDAIVAELNADPAVHGVAVDFSPVQLAEGVALLTYRIVGERNSLRSSIWVKDPQSGWRVRFHQGTSQTAK